MELCRDEYPDLAEEVTANLAEKDTPPADEDQGNDMPHSSAVESQGAKRAIFPGKSRMMNRICARGKMVA
jgi:hypothetical protein